MNHVSTNNFICAHSTEWTHMKQPQVISPKQKYDHISEATLCTLSFLCNWGIAGGWALSIPSPIYLAKVSPLGYAPVIFSLLKLSAFLLPGPSIFTPPTYLSPTNPLLSLDQQPITKATALMETPGTIRMMRGGTHNGGTHDHNQTLNARSQMNKGSRKENNLYSNGKL